MLAAAVAGVVTALASVANVLPIVGDAAAGADKAAGCKPLTEDTLPETAFSSPAVVSVTVSLKAAPETLSFSPTDALTDASNASGFADTAAALPKVTGAFSSASYIFCEELTNSLKSFVCAAFISFSARISAEEPETFSAPSAASPAAKPKA